MSSNQSSLKKFKVQFALLSISLAVMWGIECINFLLGGNLDQYGIIPRSIPGLRGILFAPFLHASFPHLIANSLPFLILGWFVMLRRTSDFLWVSAIAMLIGGLGTWLIAPAYTVHVGASGVIFGYLGFLISRGYFERSLLSVLLSIIVGVLYGGLLWGVLPGKLGISWQGHLFGFTGGIIAARLLVGQRKNGGILPVR